MFENHFDCIKDTILPYFCTIPCVVKIKGEGLTKGGAEKWLPEKDLKCHYQNAKQIRTYSDKSIGEDSSGVAYFPGDIAPEIVTTKTLIGIIEIKGIKYNFEGERITDAFDKVIYTTLTFK